MAPASAGIGGGRPILRAVWQPWRNTLLAEARPPWRMRNRGRWAGDPAVSANQGFRERPAGPPAEKGKSYAVRGVGQGPGIASDRPARIWANSIVRRGGDRARAGRVVRRQGDRQFRQPLNDECSRERRRHGTPASRLKRQCRRPCGRDCSRTCRLPPFSQRREQTLATTNSNSRETGGVCLV